MKAGGKLQGAYIDIGSKKLVISLLTNISPEDIWQIQDIDLDIEFSKHREKRSLDANAYFHVLVGKIAEKLSISKPRAKNILLGRYGQRELLPDGSEMVYKTNAPIDYMLEKEDIHSICVKQVDDTYFYKIIKGSHEYDTCQMSSLIAGTIEEAKELGIDIMTPDEVERMVRSWRSR